MRCIRNFADPHLVCQRNIFLAGRCAASENSWQKNLKKVGLYALLAVILMSAEGFRVGAGSSAATLIARAVGQFFGSFLLVAIIGEIIISIRLKIRKHKDRLG